MKGIQRAKKGFSLIEVIISVAVLAVLMIPIASVTIATVKRNDEAEDKQRANFEGQKLLEELKSFDNITINPATATSVEKAILPNGESLDVTRGTNANPLLPGPIEKFTKISYPLTGANSDLYATYVLNRKLDATYSDVTPYAINMNEYKQALYFFKDASNTQSVGLDSDYDGNPDSTSVLTDISAHNLLVLHINNAMQIQLYKREFTGGTFVNHPIGTAIDAQPLVTGNKILIKLDTSYINITNNINLYVESEYTQPITFVVFRDDRPQNQGTIEIKTKVPNPDTHLSTIKMADSINVQNNKSTYRATNIGDLYAIHVEITKPSLSSPIFEGDAIENILVN
jgi:prepilin-type N-terminal cleavage/methylation domain-containing protein